MVIPETARTQTRDSHRQRRIWILILGLAVLAGALTLVGYAQTPAATSKDAVPGIPAPKYIDVSAPALGGTVKTRYYEAGQGEPMVLVHGGGFAGYYSANVWSTVLPGLGKRFHVFAPDKLAAGMTDNPPDDKSYNIAGETEHIYQLIQTLKLGRVHLVGQSRGAGLALYFTSLHPEVVRTLVLVDSQTAAPDTGVGVTTRASLMSPCPQDRDSNWECEMRVLSYYGEKAFPDSAYVPGVYMGNLPKSKTTMARMKAGAGNSNWNEEKARLHERLKRELVLTMPVLIYWGYNDPQATRDRGLALYRNIAAHTTNVRMIWVNRAGHFNWREYPEEFVHNITDFVTYWGAQSPALSSSDKSSR